MCPKKFYQIESSSLHTTLFSLHSHTKLHSLSTVFPTSSFNTNPGATTPIPNPVQTLQLSNSPEHYASCFQLITHVFKFHSCLFFVICFELKFCCPFISFHISFLLFSPYFMLFAFEFSFFSLAVTSKCLCLFNLTQNVSY